MADFAAKLKEGTKEAHAEVQEVSVVSQIIDKSITKEKYAGLIARYYHMYSTLEEAVTKHKDDAYIKNVYFAVLNRVPALEADLAYYLGENWNSSEISKEAEEGTKEFRARIAEIAEKDPVLLVAHMYVRYLGDLAGGQMIGGKLRGCFEGESLPDKMGDKDSGFKFYVFEIDNPRKLSMTFKEGLNKLVVAGDAKATEALQEKVIDEAVTSYNLNHDVLSQLDD